MDVSPTPIIVSAIFTLIEPYLALLIKGSIEKISEKIPDSIGRLWNIIFSRFTKTPEKKIVLDDLIKSPDDKDIQAAFRVQLRKIIDEDPDFKNQILSILNDDFQNVKFNAKVYGDGAISQGTNSKSVGAGGIFIEGESNSISLGNQKTE